MASAGADISRDFTQRIVAIGDLSPMGTRKNAHPRQVRMIQFYLPPRRVGREFAPHSSPAAEKQCPSQCILVCIPEVGGHHNRLQPLPVAVKFRVIKLVPVLPSVPLKSSAAGIEPVGLQHGESVAAAGFAERERELVADQSAATAGEDWRTAGEACALLLASPGGRTSEPAAVRGDA